VVVLRFTISDPDVFFKASKTIHIVGLIVLIYKLIAHKSCSGKFLSFSLYIGHFLNFFPPLGSNP
jgi:hypothetical protein